MSNTIRNGNEVKGNPISTHFHVPSNLYLVTKEFAVIGQTIEVKMADQTG